LSLLPLPLTGERRGDLTDPAEIARIQADARTLYGRLLADRTVAMATPGPRAQRHDMPTLSAAWQAGQHFKAKKPRTQQGYAYHAGLIEAWSASVNHPLVASMTRQKIEEYLATFDDRPTTRRHVKIVLKMLLDHAVDLEWMDRNPIARMKMAAPKTSVVIWELADVERFSLAAALWGQPAMAALIRTQWEIGQRLTDVRLFRRADRGNSPAISALGAEYNAVDGVFRFWQSKTQSYVTVPVSDALRGMLGDVEVEGSPYLFLDAHDLRPFDEQRLGHLFIALKAAVKKATGEARRFTLRGLRHACVVQMARASCTPPEIAAITGHSLTSVNHILSVYLPRDNEVAWNAQVKRGLVKRRETGSP
jgi:integrase